MPGDVEESKAESKKARSASSPWSDFVSRLGKPGQGNPDLPLDKQPHSFSLVPEMELTDGLGRLPASAGETKEGHTPEPKTDAKGNDRGNQPVGRPLAPWELKVFELNDQIQKEEEDGDLRKAEADLRTLLKIEREHYGPNSPQVSGTNGWLGVNLDEQGRYADAEPYLKEAIRIETEYPYKPNRNFSLGATLDELSQCLMAQGKYQEAEKASERSLKIMEAYYGPDDIQGMPHALTILARTKTHLGKYAEAESLFERALKNLSKGSPDNPEYIEVLDAYADLLKRTGRPGDAERAEKLSSRAEALKKGWRWTPRTYPDPPQS